MNDRRSAIAHTPDDMPAGTPDPATGSSNETTGGPARGEFLYFIVLVAATAIGPMSLHIYLPSLPAIQHYFAVSAGVAQLGFSLSLAAIAIATLAYGPLSDRYGRRPVLLVGLGLFLFGSAMCALAPSIGVLNIGRLLQAAGGAAGMTLTRAIVRDLYGREKAASVIGYLMVGMVLAPMFSPAIGGVLNDVFNWRANFAFVTLVGMIVTAAVFVRLQETNTKPASFEGVRAMLASFGYLIRKPMFRGFTFHGAFSIAMFFSILAGAPYVVVTVMGRPATEYGLYFIILPFAFMVGSLVAARISQRVGIERMVIGGATIAFIGSLLVLMSLAVWEWTPLALFAPAGLAAFGNGLSLPSSQAGALSVEPRLAGTASGLSGFLQMATAAAAAQIVGMIQNGTPYPTVGMMVAGSALALIAIVVPVWRARLVVV